ncbi:hypothetical protein GCM10027040_27150 [Halomonas shantousis]
MHKLDLTQEEREYMNELRMLATDNRGDEIVVGLSRDESLRYIESHRVFLSGEGGHSGAGIDDYMMLQAKHERARMAGMAADSSPAEP